MDDFAGKFNSIERLPSGIAGLDIILHGGFLRGGIYILMGVPGTGKTILANQICFNTVAAGGQAVYVTLLAETHARMLTHLQSMEFFTPGPIAQSLNYYSGFRELENEGLTGLLNLLRRIIRDKHPEVLVIDGLAAANDLPVSDSTFKHFIHELHVFGEAYHCTIFLLTQLDHSNVHPEHTMVDGLIELSDRIVGLQAVRELLVRKFRGSEHMRGRHFFDITGAGIVAFPRVEALLRPTAPAAITDERKRLGIAKLDDMLHGGIPAMTTTMVLGPSGSGKTLLGMHFLAEGAAAGEPGLFFGFYEAPAQIASHGDMRGLNLSTYIDRGLIEIAWQSSLENVLDAIIEQLLVAVRRRQVSRLFIDGLNGLQEAAIYPERIARALSALSNELRGFGVTTMVSFEASQMFGPALDAPASGVSELVDNIILMRYVELRSHLYRLISIIELRGSKHDMAIREFTITDSGIDVAATFASAEAILTGIGHPVPQSAKAASTSKRPPRARGR
jgi:circadian clock protein KaiC